MQLEIVSVNVGRPEVVGTRRGRPVRSAIGKTPLAPTLGGVVDLGVTGLAGDAVADRRLHGGPDMAVCVYSADHWPAWDVELGWLPTPGWVGENLTITGGTEDTVRIGDVWRWGEAVVQVSEARTPCFKLALRHGTPLIAKRMQATGWVGWYLRVLEPGAVPLAGTIDVVERGSETVLAAFRELPGAATGRATPALR